MTDTPTDTPSNAPDELWIAMPSSDGLAGGVFPSGLLPREEVESICARRNARFGSYTWTPVRYIRADLAAKAFFDSAPDVDDFALQATRDGIMTFFELASQKNAIRQYIKAMKEQTNAKD